MNNIVCYEWIPCTDENYWTDLVGYETIVSFIDCEGNRSLYTRNSCPYGWNVLCDAKANLMNIIL